MLLVRTTADNNSLVNYDNYVHVICSSFIFLAVYFDILC